MTDCCGTTVCVKIKLRVNRDFAVANGVIHDLEINDKSLGIRLHTLTPIRLTGINLIFQIFML